MLQAMPVMLPGLSDETGDLKPRRAWVAVLFNIIFCGLGYLYVASPVRGAVLLLSYIIIQCSFLMAGLTADSFVWLLGSTALAIGFYIFVCVDAALIARRQKDFKLRFYNRWYFYLVYALCLYTFYTVFWTDVNQKYGGKSYSIVTENMRPTLQSGDIVMCAKPRETDNWYKAGDIVAVRIGDKNAIRRIESVALETIHLIADTPDLDSSVAVPAELPRSEISCQVTYIVFSTDKSRIGRNMK